MTIIAFIKQYSLVILVAALLGILAAAAQYIVRSNAAFSHAFLVYAASADEADTAAFILTAANNPVRIALNTVLIQVLQDKMTAQQREMKARQGLEIIKAARAQIDEMASRIEEEATAIFEMEKSVTSRDALFQRGIPQKIVDLARKRLEATKDIQALSYRANFETTKIFEHIIGDNGSLSDQYLTELNNNLAATEEEFAQRQIRYRELQSTFDQIQSAYAEFSSITALKKQ